jgi:transglutaminase superfamily protein
MSGLTVHHSTVYRYREPAGLGEHRMMFRPRESHDLRLLRLDFSGIFDPLRIALK